MSLSVRVAVAAAAVLALSGCGSDHVYDQEAHRAALEAHGVEVTGDMDVVTEAAEAACESDDPVMFAAGFLGEGGDPEVLLINVEHACPDRLGEFEDATS